MRTTRKTPNWVVEIQMSEHLVLRRRQTTEDPRQRYDRLVRPLDTVQNRGPTVPGGKWA